ncbi:elongation factor P--(R)-beta-lysine ligase [Thalassotalea insulae]|uniref:Elongation factor P--(R)-beta-lysine ligase n=1 Tax=Thalassotalea insulae TaxID=2056778 RepID=A0ABQ6GQ45_9GAMM|nr:elongation factor P--(R)-beta-lysine ligase [Thalassotalea insulae]GLX78098.1 elongation factor P--(R)-beta-lysine ligase [Thalassotalea insulae]
MWKTDLSWQVAKLRADYLNTIRSFFLEKNVVEVETPLLSQGTVTDVHLEAFDSRYDFLSSKCEGTHLFLQTSPEFAMKRLLASGYGSIYQICKAFRYEEAGRFHNPEFTMLEWYRIGFDHFHLMEEVSELLQQVLACKPASKISYQQAFQQYLNIDPLDTSLSELKQLMTEQNILGDWIAEETDHDVLLQVLFSECIEPKIGQQTPCFVYHYPSSQSALAKISALDNRVAERFECYFKGVELANGFNELTDACEQVERFEKDNQHRRKLGKAEKPIDNRFIAALTEGLPQCSGVALGVDRLLMLALETNTIAETMTFNIDKA